MARAKKPAGERAEMTVADLASLIQTNDKALRALVATLPTRAEIATLATKAEVATLPTRAEIATLATKAEVANLATKGEVADLVAKNDESVASLEASVNRSFTHMMREAAELRAEVADRFQSIEMKILGVGNRIDILIDRTPSREEFGRLERRVVALEMVKRKAA